MFHLQEHIEGALFEPTGRAAEKPWAEILRALRYPYALIRDLWKGDLNLRAMSLVYTMLLADRAPARIRLLGAQGPGLSSRTQAAPL